MKEAKERRPYETPAVVFERELEALADYCGDVQDDVFLGGNNCKGLDICEVQFS